jgi:hypothetical protein
MLTRRIKGYLGILFAFVFVVALAVGLEWGRRTLPVPVLVLLLPVLYVPVIAAARLLDRLAGIKDPGQHPQSSEKDSLESRPDARK